MPSNIDITFTVRSALLFLVVSSFLKIYWDASFFVMPLVVIKDILLLHSMVSGVSFLQWCKNKMVARTSKRSREGQVHTLNDLSFVDLLYKEKSKRKITLNKSLDIFRAERNCNLNHLLLNKEKI